MTFNKQKIYLIFIALIAVLALVGCDISGTDPDPDTTAPMVTSTNPADGATDVAITTDITTDITATFSEEMEGGTIDETSFTLYQGATAVSGTVSYDDATMITSFTPESDLAFDTKYTATITTGVTDLAGNELVADKIWTFTTGIAPDTTAPTVTSTNPVHEAIDVAITTDVTATFSKDMDGDTINVDSYTLATGSTSVTGTVTYDADTMVASFTPESDLAYDTVYTATITTGATDLAGNALEQNKIWTFTTGIAPDTTAPTVTSTNPAHEAIDVAITTDITATFSEDMDGDTINTTNFTLKEGATAVSGTVSYDDTTMIATFNPAADLAYDTKYTATITTGATDLAGNALAADKIWTFTTVAATTVDLGTAANYTILAKTGVSTTGTTLVTGNIGVSPADLTAITGFAETMDGSGTFATSTYVDGNIYAADMTEPTPDELTTAVDNMMTAYTYAAELTDPDYTDLGAGEIGGMTLEPGLYKWGTAVSITTDVTLSGSSTATWVFQVGGALTMAASTQVILEGGAQAENIVWQIGTNTTIGASSVFAGTLLTSTYIALGSGTTVNGRLLAQTAVTLDANDVQP